MSTDDTPLLDIPALLTQLSDTAVKLNDASNALGVIVADIEAQLKKLNIGVEAWVMAGKDTKLGYSKITHGSRWGLMIACKIGNPTPEMPDPWEYFYFNDATRALRVNCVPKLWDLLEALAVVAKAAVDRVTVAAERARKIQEAMK